MAFGLGEGSVVGVGVWGADSVDVVWLAIENPVLHCAKNWVEGTFAAGSFASVFDHWTSGSSVS